MTGDPMKAIAQGRKRCYVVLESQYDEGGFIPSLVVEYEQGHWPMTGGEGQRPWHWGKTFVEAQRACASVNARLGISEAEASRIVATTMRQGGSRA